MKKIITPTLFLALIAAAGCASDEPGKGDDGGGGGSGGGGGGDGEVPLTPEGRFGVQSEFDLATNLPGTAGTIATYFIEATDDPDDPTKFLVEKLIEKLPNGPVKSVVENAAPFVTGYLNQRLLQFAPDLFTRLVNVGDAFGQVAHHFGTHEVLEVTAAGQCVKTVDGLHFSIDMVEQDLLFKDYQLPDTRIDGLTVNLEPSGKINIAEHKVGLKYGQILKLALDKAIIPNVDPSAQNLSDLLHHAVNCTKVGQFVYDAVNFGSPGVYESACNTGLTMAADGLYNKLADIDGSAVELTLTGVARGVDKNRDGKLDDILTGTWQGGVTYAGTPGTLPDGKFFGKRL